MRSALCLVASLAAWCAPASPAWATTVYKSVDDAGNVTYSMSPPPSAIASAAVEVHGGQPDPTATARLATERERLEESTRQTLERERRLRAARDALESARRALDEARQIRDEDWLGTYGPYRRLKPEYYQRVREARARLAEAERAVEGDCAGGCEDLSWKLDVGSGASFRATGNVRHAEERLVELDAAGRHIGHSADRRPAAGAGSRSAASAAGRQAAPATPGRREVWNAQGRTTVRNAEERHGVD